MTSKNYPIWTCTKCAEKHGGIINNAYASFHENICSVCNEWALVSQPSIFGYPHFTSNWDRIKIFDQLVQQFLRYIKERNALAVLEVADRLDDIIQEILEHEFNDETITPFSSE